MELEDFFERKHKRQENYREHSSHQIEKPLYDSHHSHHNHDENFKWLSIWAKIRNNNKIKMLVILLAIFILVIAIVLIIVLLPLIIKLVDYVSQNGIKGLLDSVVLFLNKILMGSGK